VASAPVGSASPVQLGLRAATRLLPVLVDPGRSIDLTPLSARKPSATALWIQGEREYRRSRYRSALSFYQRAVREDSAMAFAALKGAQAAGWENLGEEAQKFVAVALARRSLLPSKQQAFARGWQAYLSGNADSAVHWLKQAVAEDPEWAEGHMALGEVFYHLLPTASLPLDSLAQAEFSQAVRYDSGFAPPLYHLAESAIRQNNLKAAADLIERFQQFQPDSTRWRQLAVMHRCVRDGPAAVEWKAEVSRNPMDVVQVAKSLSVGGAHAECAERGYRALLADSSRGDMHWGSFVGLHGITMAQRRYAELIPLIDSAVAVGVGRAPAMYFIDALLGAPVKAKAQETDSIWRSRFGEEYTGVSLETRCILAHWLAHQRDTVRLRKLSRSLAAEAKSTRLPLRRMLDGHLALARADTAGAVRIFRSLRVNVPVVEIEWGLMESLALERWILAEFAVSRGEFAEAHLLSSVFDHPTPVAYLPFVPEALTIRLRAAQGLGRRDLVTHYQARLRQLRDPEDIALGFSTRH
jgi:tetratricopeptide (TPR) repeat protein